MPPPSEIDPTDPWLRETQTFPELSPEMMRRIAAYGEEEEFGEDKLLFERGHRSIDFFLLVDGEIEIFATNARSGRTVLYTYKPGQFSGELNLFNSRQVLLSGLAKAGTRVVRVVNADFRKLISGEPDIGEIIMRAFILRRVGFIRHSQGGVLLAGHRHGADFMRLQRFMTRNGYPLEIVDVDVEDDAADFLRRFALDAADLPAVIAPDGSTLRNPSNAALADRLGLMEAPEEGVVYDIAVVGAGPSGLAAAVYGASEGLRTIVVESLAPGGQAGTSSKIENYLGFPTGISGQGLAGRAHIQAQKFGARLAISRAVVALDCSDHPHRLELDEGLTLRARAVVVATGARYRKLDLPGYDKYEGQGIQYAATQMEAQVCSGENVVVVGGGNSAGQAAMFLSRTARHVHMLVRSDLSATMSDYLVQRILGSPRITVHTRTEITALHGDGDLDGVTWINRATDEEKRVSVGSIFVMIGAEPNTDWLRGCLDLDRKGFVKTGVDGDGNPSASPYATTLPGIFAVGDVRSGSVKRVASAVGEGSVVVQAIHAFLHPEPI
jgi:thioredoxin reductase (NADPH)